MFSSFFSGGGTQSALPFSTELSILSSDHKIHEGRFLKLGHVLKNWKSRRYVLVQRQMQDFDIPEVATMNHPAIKSESAQTRKKIDILTNTRIPLLLYFDKDTDTVAKGVLAITEAKFSLEGFAAVKAIAQTNAALLEDGDTFYHNLLFPCVI
jgi:hypothetical protein